MEQNMTLGQWLEWVDKLPWQRQFYELRNDPTSVVKIYVIQRWELEEAFRLLFGEEE